MLALSQIEIRALVEALTAESARRMRLAEGAEVKLAAGGEPTAVSLRAEMRKLASLIDHTLLRPEATRVQVKQLCREALQFGFAAAYVNPVWVPTASKLLQGSSVRVGTVVGFPLGATATSAKRAEAEVAILLGAQEIDMVMNIGAIKSGDLERVESDVRGVVEVCHPAEVVVKVILETAYLTEAEKVAACQVVKTAGADFVKTSTGFGPSGASEHDVRLMRQAVGPEMGVKAAGGIHTLAAALGMLEAGANRLGTSASVAILEEASSLVA
jgi:deoxyribose-phosphate aldolase